MKEFLARHGSDVKGVLSGWDRIRFRGAIRHWEYRDGMWKFLSFLKVLLKDFREWAQSVTHRIRQATEQLATDAGRPVIYLASSQVRKEYYIREIASRDGIEQGLIAVLTCVEPCRTWQVYRNAKTKHLELESVMKKCLFHYFYFQDSRFGLMHVRLQTWLPFTVHVCLNGREWLAEDLKRISLPFEKRDNCFVAVGDVLRAQQLLDQQRHTDWMTVLSDLQATVHPTHATLFGQPAPRYYWSAVETEWATDVMFGSADTLAKLYRPFIQYGVANSQASDVLRYFGRRPLVQMLKTAQVESHLGTRTEGTRLKHWLEGNSLKMYDKQGSVLRVETTINNPHTLKVQRGTEKNPAAVQRRSMRKAVVDLPRRADACQSINERYLDSLAAVSHQESLQQTIAPLCQPTELQGRRVRALSPLNEQDRKLLVAISRPEFLLHGFRNQDLRTLLFADDATHTLQQQSGKVTRLLRLLRAHKLIRKVQHSNRYQVTTTGRRQITAIIAAQLATTEQLTKMAA